MAQALGSAMWGAPTVQGGLKSHLLSGPSHHLHPPLYMELETGPENFSALPRPTASKMAGREPKTPSSNLSTVPGTQVAFPAPTRVSSCKSSEQGEERTPLSDGPCSLWTEAKESVSRGEEFAGTLHVISCQPGPHTHLLSLPHPRLSSASPDW